MDDRFIQHLRSHKRNLTFSSDGVHTQSFSQFKQSYQFRNLGLEALNPSEARDRAVRGRGGRMYLSGYELDTVIWGSNFITVQPVGADRDVISFDFGGCAMAAFLNGGVWTAAHIHSGTAYDYDHKRTWIRYLSRYPDLTQLKMFQPRYRLCSGRRWQTWGVITREGGCYSLFVEPLRGERSFMLRRIWEHNVSTDPAAYRSILNPALIAGRDDAANFNPLKQAWDNFWDQQTGGLLGDDCGCCGLCL